MEDASDGRGRRDSESLALEVPGDGDRAGIEPAGGELGAQGDDPGADGLAGLLRAGVRPSGARLEGIEPAVAVAAAAGAGDV